jgi:hypothetical protein
LPARGALAELGADLGGGLGLLQVVCIHTTLSRSMSECSSVMSLPASWAAVILGPSAIVVSSSSILGSRPTIMRLAVAEFT